MSFLENLKNKFSDDHGQVTQGHKGNITHDLLVAAATYEAAKGYQHHLEKNGKPQSHEAVKNITAALIGGTITHLVETKGLDFIDKEKAKKEAAKHIDEITVKEYQS